MWCEELKRVGVKITCFFVSNKLNFAKLIVVTKELHDFVCNEIFLISILISSGFYISAITDFSLPSTTK